MGNEMGNNNTSGFQEESNTTAEAPEKSLQEAGHIDDVKGENQVIPPAESEEYNEKITISDSDDPKVGDTQVGDQKSREREQETEVDATNGTEKSLQEPLQQDDLNTTHSAESEPSCQKIEDSASDDPKMPIDVHGGREPKETEVDPPTESKGRNEEVVSSTSDDQTEVGDDHVENLVLPERDQEESEVHPPSISNAADTPKTSPKEDVYANDLKADNNINLPTETKTYLEKGLSLATDDPKEVRDAYVDNQKAEEKGQEESKLESPVNSNSTDTSEKSMQVPVHDDDVKGKNHALPNAPVNENCASSSSADPKVVVGDDPVHEHKSGKGEQKETQVHLPTKSNEVDAPEISIQDSLHKDDVIGQDPATEENGVQHTLISVALEDCKESNYSGISGFQLEKQASNNTAEEEEVITATEPQKSGDQHESPETLADPSSQHGGESPHGSNTRLITELACHIDKNGHLIHTEIANNQSASVATSSALEELSTKMNFARNESSESLPQVKCMVLTEETKLAGKESADEEIKNEHSLAQLGEKFVNESKIKVSNTSEADFIVIGSNQEINEESKFILNDCQGNMLEAPQEDSEGQAVVAQNDTSASNAAVMSQFSETSFDHKKDSVMVSDNAENSIEPLLKMKQESVSNAADLRAKTLVSAVELAFAKPVRDLPPLAARTAPPVAEIKTPANQANGHCTKDETSRFSCGSSGAQSVGRSSTESNPESLSIHSQMRKSPSFNLDLLNEARKEETEQTPQLYQDKAATEQSLNQAEVSLGNGHDLLQFHAKPAEERVVTLETSDSDKSRASFLGFLKDEEEANIVITPQGHGNHTACPKKPTNSKVVSKDVRSSSAKAKEKRKPRPFLFGTCMCCAAVIN